MITPFCVLCGGFDPQEEHHVIPRVYGGSDDYTNIISVCGTCHAKIHEFGVRRGNMRELQAEGIKRARAAGVYANRPKPATDQTETILVLRAEGRPPQIIADTCGIGVASVYRVIAAARRRLYRERTTNMLSK